MVIMHVDPNHTFFTSDTHFCHSNIIKLCKRPFNSVEEMNETLIENWNKVVSDNDTVFHLGDFAFNSKKAIAEILPRLKGNIHLILGNHDDKHLIKNSGDYFKSIQTQLLITAEKIPIYLNHFPFLCYAGGYKGAWQLFGHVHSGYNTMGMSKSRLSVLLPTQYDVGVDNNDFTPISYLDLKWKIEDQKYNDSIESE